MIVDKLLASSQQTDHLLEDQLHLLQFVPIGSAWLRATRRPLTGNSDRVRLVLAKLQFPARRRRNLSEYAPHSERRATRGVR